MIAYAWSLWSSSGICVGMYGLTCSLYQPTGYGSREHVKTVKYKYLRVSYMGKIKSDSSTLAHPHLAISKLSDIIKLPFTAGYDIRVRLHWVAWYPTSRCPLLHKSLQPPCITDWKGSDTTWELRMDIPKKWNLSLSVYQDEAGSLCCR